MMAKHAGLAVAIGIGASLLMPPWGGPLDTPLGFFALILAVVCK